MSTALTLIVAIVGSTAVASLIQFFVSRHDNKKNIPEKLETLEKDVLRTQILLMIMLRPDEEHEILTVSRHYFVDLNGDWYLTGVFNSWCEERGQNPEWFDKNK